MIKSEINKQVFELSIQSTDLQFFWGGKKFFQQKFIMMKVTFLCNSCNFSNFIQIINETPKFSYEIILLIV